MKKKLSIFAIALAAVLAVYTIRADAGGGMDDHGHEEESKEHGGGEEHEEEVVRLSREEMKEFGVEIRTAGPEKLRIYISLPGEVKTNADRLAHIVPRVSGVVRDVRKRLGDKVRRGEVMAVLESRELADAKSAYLAAIERFSVAEADFRREENLWKKRISPEKNYLRARRMLAEARIELRSAKQKLFALGLPDEYIASLSDHPEASYTRYEITAPFDGTVIEKHIALGEAVEADSTVFVVADLSTVWVDLSVYQKDLPLVRVGQEVVLSAGYGIEDATGRISYVGPVVGEETRTAIARVVLPNRDGRWRPGLFVTGRIAVDEITVPVAVPRSAVQEVEGRPSVFVETDEGFVPRVVNTGRKDTSKVEISSGLEPGERYVAKGAFILKAQLSKGAFGEGHSH